MNISRILAVVFAIVCVALAAVAFNFQERNRVLSDDLAQATGKLDRQHAGYRSGLNDDAGGLRQALATEESANTALREEIARLKGQPVVKRAPNPTNQVAQSTNRGDTGGGGSSWMDRLKQEDPERYKQMVQQREQRRQATEAWYNDQLAALDQRAATTTSKEEADVANQIADALAKLSDLRSQWENLRSIPDDEQRHTAMEDLQTQTREAYTALNTARELDRNLQFGSLLRSAGITDPNAIQAGVEGINNVLTSTTYSPPHGEGGGPGGRGGGGWRSQTTTTTATPPRQ